MAGDGFWLPITSGAAASGVPLIAAKSADETVASSTAMQADNDLTIAVDANTRYALTMFLLFNAPATPDIQIGWSVPAGATLNWHRETSGVTGTTGLTDALVATNTEPIAGDGADDVFVIHGFVKVGATAGTVTFQWAQLASDAAATTVRAGSWLKLEPIA